MAAPLGVRIATARCLGLRNVARVVGYRLLLKAGLHPVQHLDPAIIPSGQWFRARPGPSPAPPTTRWLDRADYFGWYRPALDATPPAWHRNPFDGRLVPKPDQPWWQVSEASTGDIKAVWEASRLTWAPNLAQRARVGDANSGRRLNVWLEDWALENPPYRGPNWRCGQEASIRIMELAVAALILDEVNAPEPPLVAAIEAHLRRIAPTLSYAIGQDNNHGTSEAAALFIGGSWLEALGRRGVRWRSPGATLLVERLTHLVEPDGTFSQYSVTYHRLLLETLCLVEVWRRLLALPALPNQFYDQAKRASAWLRSVVDPTSGDAPNLGANDGAQLLPLTDADYRDFRPAVQLASALFEHAPAYPAGPWDDQLRWLGVDTVAGEPVAPTRRVFDQGGLTVLETGPARVVLRHPRCRFRPSQADPLHLDLWVGGVNLLRDAGSYSYAGVIGDDDPFAGVRGHNTVQFDDREPMYRLGRFLWGPWLTADDYLPPGPGAEQVRVAYRTVHGAVHHRTARLQQGCLTVIDKLTGFSKKAVLRWRLAPGPWTVSEQVVRGPLGTLSVGADVPLVRTILAAGWESRYYLQKAELPVLELEIREPGTFTTEVRWPA